MIDIDLKTALTFAANDNHVNVLKYLIGNRANVNHEDSFGKTPLLRAVEKVNLESVKVLLDFGASLESTDSDR